MTLDYPDSESAPGALFYLAESYYRAESLDQALAGFNNFTTTHPDHELAELGHPVLVGEVSMVNDDNLDNRFYEPIGRFPEIEEDEPPLYLLVGDYESIL